MHICSVDWSTPNLPASPAARLSSTSCAKKNPRVPLLGVACSWVQRSLGKAHAADTAAALARHMQCSLVRALMQCYSSSPGAQILSLKRVLCWHGLACARRGPPVPRAWACNAGRQGRRCSGWHCVWAWPCLPGRRTAQMGCPALRTTASALLRSPRQCSTPYSTCQPLGSPCLCRQLCGTASTWSWCPTRSGCDLRGCRHTLHPAYWCPTLRTVLHCAVQHTPAG